MPCRAAEGPISALLATTAADRERSKSNAPIVAVLMPESPDLSKTVLKRPTPYPAETRQTPPTFKSTMRGSRRSLDICSRKGIVPSFVRFVLSRFLASCISSTSRMSHACSSVVRKLPHCRGLLGTTIAKSAANRSAGRGSMSRSHCHGASVVLFLARCRISADAGWTTMPQT